MMVCSESSIVFSVCKFLRFKQALLQCRQNKKWADLRLRCCVFCGSAVVTLLATDGCFAVFGLRKKKVANERVCITLCFTAAHYEYFHLCLVFGEQRNTKRCQQKYYY